MPAREIECAARNNRSLAWSRGAAKDGSVIIISEDDTEEDTERFAKSSTTT